MVRSMKDKHEIQSLGEIFLHLLQQYNLTEPYQQARLRSYWPQLMGTTVSSYTLSIKLSHHKLYVRLSSSVLREELRLQVDLLQKKLNEYLKEEVIQHIYFS